MKNIRDTTKKPTNDSRIHYKTKNRVLESLATVTVLFIKVFLQSIWPLMFFFLELKNTI